MAASRPNVVLFVSDRQHADTIHAGGTAGIATPHLDRLASDGVLFHRAYTTSPILLTGANGAALRALPA